MTEPSAETAYLFRHALVRDAAYELQPPTDRAWLHGIAVDAIEQLCGGPPAADARRWSPRPQPHSTDAFLSGLVEHSSLAPDSAEMRRKAALYLYRAGSHEIAGYRMTSAMQILRKLVTHPGADDYLRARAHFQLGEILYRLGELAAGKAEYTAAQRLVNPALDPDGDIVLRSCQTVVDSHTDNGPQVAQTHREAADYWRGRGDLRKMLGSLINFAVWHCEAGDEQVAHATLDEVVAHGRQHGLPLAVSAGVGIIALLHDRNARYAEAEAGLIEAIAAAREGGDPVREVGWLINLAEICREAGRLDDATGRLREASRVCARFGLDARREHVDANLAGVLLQQGRYTDARELWNPAWESLAKRGDPYNLNVVRIMMNDALKRSGKSPLPESGLLP